MSGAEVELVLDARDSVGESVVWDERTGTLHWVDIGGIRVHRLALATGQHQVIVPPERPTSIGLCQDGRLILGLMKRVVLWDAEAGFETLAEIEPDLPDNRLNEGQVAPDGSYWVGTMQNNLTDGGRPKPIAGEKGQLLRISPSGKLTVLTSDRFGITNTMLWLDDGRFVTADTSRNALLAYELDPSGCRLDNSRSFAAPLARGLPDGSCLDVEGFVWNCRVAGGGCLVRFAPDGAVDRIVDLPCSSPTSCCFGDLDLDVLYVTSARFGLNDAHLADHPEEGGLFAVRGAARGRLARRFGARA
ncbi:MAG: Gluconolactonase [Hyphomicrobiales bacterium]|nr:Gluconolactonase [Hyphomicrobiales bacterium]